MDLTVKEYARVERVTARTVRRWIDKGAVEIRRTPGGGIRIRASSGSGPVVLSMSSNDKRGQSSN